MEQNNNFSSQRKPNKYINDNILDLMNERIEMKLSLRKKKIIDKLNSQRHKPSNIEVNNKINYNYKLFSFINIEIPSQNNDNEISIILDYLKSDDIKKVKIGVFSLHSFINEKNISREFLEKEIHIFFPCLLALIYDNIHDKEFIFNILYIMTDLSFKINNNNIKDILNQQFFSMINSCFLKNDCDINYQIICILNNIFQDISINSFEIVNNEFFKKTLIEFFSRKEVIFDMEYNKNESDLSFHIIEGGITLFCTLLTSFIECLTEEEEDLVLFKKFLDIIFIFSNINELDKYLQCLYSIKYVVERNLSLIDSLLEKKFIIRTLFKKKFFDNKDVLLYINKIILLCLDSDKELDRNHLYTIFNFETYYLEYIDLNSNKKEIFDVLSNLINEDQLVDEIFMKDNFIIRICEILYFFTLLINKCNVNQFSIIKKNNILKIIINLAKKELSDDEDSIIIFLQLIEQIFVYGNEIKEINNGRNCMAEDFVQCGGIELFNKLAMIKNDIISEKIESLLMEYIDSNGLK